MTIPGLSMEDMSDITQVLARLPEIEKALVFGSRAKGTAKRGSDVDLVLEGAGITFDTLRSVRFALNEDSNLPYSFDVLDRSGVSSPELKEHIDRVGLVFYERR